MELRIVGAAVEHLREPVLIVCGPGAERYQARSPRSLPIAVRSAASMASRLPGSHCDGSSASTSKGANPCARFGVGPNAPDTGACWPVLDGSDVLRVLDPPHLPVRQVVSYAVEEGNNVFEDDPPLRKAGRHAHHFGPRLP